MNYFKELCKLIQNLFRRTKGKGQHEEPREDEQGSRDLVFLDSKSYYTTTMKELFTAHGEVQANFTFLGCGSEKQTPKYKQI